MESDDCFSEIVDQTIGTKLASFYLILRQNTAVTEQNHDVSIHQYDIISSLMEIEFHPSSDSEPIELLREIVVDCEKKCAQYFRNHFQDTVQEFISSSRKKLTSKVIDKGDSSYQRSSRHILSLLELLGTWSNLIHEFSSTFTTVLSRDLFHYIMIPFHERIVDLAWDFYQQFVIDKNLNTFQKKIINSEIFNITLLDQLLEQYAQICDTISKYLQFFSEIYHNTELLRVTPYSSLLPNNCIVTSTSSTKLKELDWLYVSLESGYFLGALEEACRDKKLIFVERNCCIPQYIEDVVFIIDKVCERCMKWQSLQAITLIHLKVFQYLDIADDETTDFKLGTILLDKSSYKKCFVCGELASKKKAKVSPPVSSLSHHKSFNQLASPEVPDLSVSNTSVISNVFSTTSWLVSTLESTLSTPIVTQPRTNGLDTDVLTNDDKALSFDEMLLSALDVPKSLDEDDHDSLFVKPNDELLLEDCCVYINAISAVTSSISKAKVKFDTWLETLASLSIKQGYSMISEEFTRIENSYKTKLYEEVKSNITEVLYVQHLSPLIFEAFKNKYVISGDEMEVRILDSEFIRAVSGYLGTKTAPSSMLSPWQEKLSMEGYSLMVYQTAEILSEHILHILGYISASEGSADIQQTKFSEWGAMLFHEEVMSIVKLIQDILEYSSTEYQSRKAFASVLWLIEILTLEYPGEIRRYTLPSNVFKSDDVIRVKEVMKARVEFSEEAITLAKVVIV